MNAKRASVIVTLGLVPAMAILACDSVPGVVFSSDGGVGASAADAAVDGAQSVDGSRPADAGGGGGVTDGSSDGADGSFAKCPPACNGGCVGTTCVVTDPMNALTCPPGYACDVKCNNSCSDVTCAAGAACKVECGNNQVCNANKVHCGSATTCTITCSGKSGCSDTQVDPGTSPLVCFDCSGNMACNNVTCTATPSGMKDCTGNSCGGVSNCGSLGSPTGGNCP
jgi:hypothetical protein